ncbi:MAG: GTP-binding protein [Candidatus Lokiarchaeota archaeon]|nr:GTP-binding protein [Candidatus Lokiarchaeota archaeon]
MIADYTFKLIVIGPAAVGKTSLIRRFVENRFSFNYKSTIGVDFLAKTMRLKGDKIVKLAIWDVGGQARFRFLRRNFYEGTHGAILVFDLSRANTSPKMKDWLIDMRSIIEYKIPLLILGNKSDLLSEVGEVIDREEPKRFAEQEESFYLETSAKTGNNVEQAFNEFTKQMLKSNS